MMDLTLEIFGWVESLEDALTQFTSPEDLDGDNMYRCARYVIHASPNQQKSLILVRFVSYRSCNGLKGVLLMFVLGNNYT